MARTISIANPIVQIFVALLLASMIGFLLLKSSFLFTFAILFAAVAAVVLLYKLWKPVPAFIVKLFIMSAFLETAFFAVDVGFFSLFPYRLFLLVVLLMFFVHLTFNRNELLRWDEIHVKKMIAFMAFWLGYAFLSLVWVRSFSAGVKELLFLLAGISAIVVVTFYFQRWRDYLHFFYIWIAMLVFLAGIGVWEATTGQHLHTSRILHEPGWDPFIPTGVFFNQNDYATYLAVSLFFVVALVKYGKNGLVKLGSLFLFIVTLFLIVATESRANYLAVASGFLFWFLFLTKPFHKLVIFVFAVLLAAVSGFVFFEEISLVVQHLMAEFAFITGDFREGFSEDIRINLIQNSLLFLLYSFGFGVGSGNAEFYMNQHWMFPTKGVVNVHNWWIEILVDYGIILFVGYVVLYIALIYYLYKHYKQAETNHDQMICAGLLGAFVTFFLASLSPSSMMILTYQWVLFAFGIGYVNMMRMRKHKRFKNTISGD